MTTNDQNLSTQQFLTVPELSNRFPAFSIGSLRWLIFHRDTNGLNVAVKKIGKRILIDQQAFIEWVRSH